MKISSGHLTLIVLVAALLGFAHLHQDDVRQLVQLQQQEQKQSLVAETTDLHIVPNPLEDSSIVEHSSHCVWPQDEPANETFVRQIFQTDGTARQVTEPVWRTTIQAPRDIAAIEIVDSAGQRWRLISGEATKGAPLTGRIQREAGETYFIHEDERVCFGKWQLVR